MEDYLNITIDREILIKHANEILNKKELKGVHIAQKIGMNPRQLYDYRNRIRKIEDARLETLLKFESYYQKIKDKL